MTDPDNRALDKRLKIKPIVSKWIASFDYITNFGKDIYFLTNHNAQLKKVVKFNIDEPTFENWVEVIPEHPNNLL